MLSDVITQHIRAFFGRSRATDKLYLSPAIDVRSQTQDVTPIRLGTMTMRRRIHGVLTINDCWRSQVPGDRAKGPKLRIPRLIIGSAPVEKHQKVETRFPRVGRAKGPETLGDPNRWD